MVLVIRAVFFSMRSSETTVNQTSAQVSNQAAQQTVSEW